MTAALVTGASGVVGGAVARHLAAAGRPVAGLARSPAAAARLDAAGVRAVPGDVLDPDSLVGAMKEFPVVYHAAGVNEFCARDPAPMFETNVVGSCNVVEAAARCGVSRVVYTSSAATIGERRGCQGREDSPHRGWFLSDYERSKYEAERAVLARAASLGIEVVCVNPSSVQGPGRSGGTARILVRYLEGKLPVAVDTIVSLVDVDDCAAGHVLAERRGRPGERYILNGVVLSLRDALAMAGRVAGSDRRPRMIPPAAAIAAAAAIESAARLRGRKPPVCRAMIRTMLHGHDYDGSRAERELGLRYTPALESITRTVEWLIDTGRVRRAGDAGARPGR